jgi:hypothetical protein
MRDCTQCACPQIAGVYSPVGVDSAILTTECGRTVNVGRFPFEILSGVMDERKSGQEYIALERVLRRMGR